MTEFATTLSMVEETSAFSAGNNGTYSNGRGGENECGGGKGIGTGNGSSSKKGLLCYEDGQGEELLCLWGFGHMAHHCRNWGRGRAMEERRVEYGRERFKENIEKIGHLKEVENLEVLN